VAKVQHGKKCQMYQTCPFLISQGISCPEVFFKTCVAMKFVDDDDDEAAANTSGEVTERSKHSPSWYLFCWATKIAIDLCHIDQVTCLLAAVSCRYLVIPSCRWNRSQSHLSKQCISCTVSSCLSCLIRPELSFHVSG